MRLIAYNLGQLGECKKQDGSEPSSLWKTFGIEYRHFDFSRYPRHVFAPAPLAVWGRGMPLA